MRMPPQRIALVAIVVLLLAGGAAWWWQAGNAMPARPAPVSEPDTGSSVALTPSPAGPGHAAAPMDEAVRRCGMALRDAFNARAMQLKNRQDAASQLAYALAVPVDPALNWRAMTPDAQRGAMQQQQDRQQSAMLKAAAFARGNSGFLWVVAHRCIGGEDCDAARLALLQTEPGNMLVWLREMEWARQRGDEAAATLAFERAVNAPIYDAHLGLIPKVLEDAYGTLPLPTACVEEGVQRAMQRKMGIDLGRPFGVLDQAMLAAVVHLPVSMLSPLRRHCMPNAGMDSERRVACRGILTRLAVGDIWVERMIALDVLVQMLGDDPEAAAWRERYRENRWMTTQLADGKIQALLQPEDYWNDEARSLQAALQIAGRWPPPADWLPEDERSRSMILTGKPPVAKKRN